MNLDFLSRRYLKWSAGNPPPPIPATVAKTGAGSEGRMPFTHYANVIPVYLFALETLTKLSKTKLRPAILDHGCGTGRLLAFLAHELPQARFTGIDESPACIDYAQKHYPSNNLRFYVDHTNPQTLFSRKLTQAPTPENYTSTKPGSAPIDQLRKFDLVVSSHVLEHVPPRNADSYLASLKQLLKPDGILVLGTPNRKWLQDLFVKNPRDRKLLRLILPHEHEYTYAELENLFSRHFQSHTIYGLKNPANARFSLASVRSLLPNSDSQFQIRARVSALNLFRLLLPQNLTDFIGRNATAKILARLNISYADLLIKNQPLKNFSSGLNFIVLASTAKPPSPSSRPSPPA